MNPLVSVCIPCHNAERYVAAALDSVLSQTYLPIEVVVVNDGSTDRTSEVLKDYEDRGVTVIHQRCGSASKARNLAFHESRGEYIKFFDADDLLHPEMIEKQVERINGGFQDIAFCGWGRFYKDDLSNFKLNPQSVWRDMDGRDWLVESWMNARPMMQPGQFLIPRIILLETGGWNNELTLIDDFEFFARVLCHARNVLFTPGATLYYRSGVAGCLSGRKTNAALDSAFHSLMDGVTYLLECRADAMARRASANILQDFAYSIYPRRSDLSKQIMQRVRQLGGSDISPSGPPNFHRLRKIFGWKVARLIEILVKLRRS